MKAKLMKEMRDFWFLDELFEELSPEDIDEIRIEKENPSLYEETPWMEEANCDAGFLKNYRKFFGIFKEDGNQSIHEFRKTIEYFDGCDVRRTKADNLAKQIEEHITDTNSVLLYIVECNKLYDDYDSYEEDVERYWVIYPCQDDYIDVLLESLEEAYAEIKEELIGNK